jgi:hypothetical protein
LRFVVQPVTAMLLGIRSGLADAQAGRPPYLYGVLMQRHRRRALVRSGFETVVNLLRMGMLMDAVCQWFILGVSYPGAALVVGPVLIGGPYTLARALESLRVRAQARLTGGTLPGPLPVGRARRAVESEHDGRKHAVGAKMRALVTTVSNRRSCVEEGILAYGRLRNWGLSQNRSRSVLTG